MSEEFKISFGKRIAKLRKIKGISQEILAEELGLSIKAISIIETGSHLTKSENFDKIAKVLGIEVRELFNFDNTNNKEQNLKGIYDKIEFIKDDEDKVAILYEILRKFL